MTLETLKIFFMYSSLINGAIFFYWAFFIMVVPDFTYRMQSRWFNIKREHYDVIIYTFLGLFKIFFIIFNFTPYIALVIITQ